MIMIGHHRRLREPLSRRQRRLLWAGVGILLAAVVALSAYGASVSTPAAGRGCVSVTVASSTGGALIHKCGAAARRWCAEEALLSGPVAVAVRPQCARAGYGARSGRRGE